jgi:lauroyl/myristoyl acyltransferase
MSLSKTLQSPEILRQIIGMSFDEMKEILFFAGNKYYNENASESEIIKQNLTSFGLPNDSKTVKEVQENIVYHYVEKVFPLAGTAELLAEFIENRVDFISAKTQIESAIKNGSVLITTPHFGGVECVTPTLSYMNFPVNPVLKFSTQNLSDKIRRFAESMEKSGRFARINFIELGKPNSQGALAMAGILNKKEILFSVFDEETQYSKPINLLGKKVLGGAGLDRLLKFANQNVSVFTVFMIRRNEKYEMKLIPIDLSSVNFIQQMYENLESILHKDFTQWYFLHEEIHFAD